MNELRQDPITGRWVIISTGRAKRPVDFKRNSRAIVKESDCPFCPGNEKDIPLAIWVNKGKSDNLNDPNWKVRVIPNLYPALSLEKPIVEQTQLGPYLILNGVGVHEVLITSPYHEKDLGLLPLEQVRLVVDAYIDRYKIHKFNSLVEYLMVMVNHGEEAGMSKEHPHAQVWGTPLIPINVIEELMGVQKYYRREKTCVYCDLIKYEKKEKERIIYENEFFLVFAPYASRTPFESWILPKKHWPFFESMESNERESLAEALKAVLYKLDEGLNDPPFNFFIHSTPNKDNFNELFHWHLEIYPRLSTFGGFELGAGIIVNTSLPEHCAEFLRSVPLK